MQTFPPTLDELADQDSLHETQAEDTGRRETAVLSVRIRKVEKDMISDLANQLGKSPSRFAAQLLMGGFVYYVRRLLDKEQDQDQRSELIAILRRHGLLAIGDPGRGGPRPVSEDDGT